MTTSATPATPEPESSSDSSSSVKIATPDIILDSGIVMSEEIMARLLFEEIGGQEIINVSRSDLVNGQSVVYKPIKNLSTVQALYNPKSILALQNTSDDYFNNYGLKILNYLPSTGSTDTGNTVYLDGSGNLVIELVNVGEKQLVEVQIMTSGNVLGEQLPETEIGA